MKNIFLAFVLALIAVPAFAGSCPCERAATVTKTVVTTTTEVVGVPVRVVGGLRARAAARRAARAEVRAARAEARAEALAGCCCEAESCVDCDATEAVKAE